MTFGLSPRYGIDTAREARAWFLAIVREHEEFEVSTDRAGEWPFSFSRRWYGGYGPSHGLSSRCFASASCTY